MADNPIAKAESEVIVMQLVSKGAYEAGFADGVNSLKTRQAEQPAAADNTIDLAELEAAIETIERAAEQLKDMLVRDQLAKIATELKAPTLWNCLLGDMVSMPGIAFGLDADWVWGTVYEFNDDGDVEVLLGDPSKYDGYTVPGDLAREIPVVVQNESA